MLAENGSKRVNFVIFLLRNAYVFVTNVSVKITILWKFNRRSLKNFTRSQKKNKTVSFQNYILGSLRTADVSPRSSPLRDVSRGGTSATQLMTQNLSGIRSEALIGRRSSFIVLAIVYE